MDLKDDLNLAIEFFREAYEHQMRGDLKTAVRLYKESIRAYPTAEAHTFLGWAYSLEGRLAEAIGECKKAIQIDPDFGNPYNDIGSYLISMENYDEAIPWLEKAIQAKRYDARHYPHYNLGRVYQMKDMLNKAIEEFSKALEIDPDYTLAKEAIESTKRQIN